VCSTCWEDLYPFQALQARISEGDKLGAGCKIFALQLAPRLQEATNALSGGFVFFLTLRPFIVSFDQRGIINKKGERREERGGNEDLTHLLMTRASTSSVVANVLWVRMKLEV